MSARSRIESPPPGPVPQARASSSDSLADLRFRSLVDPDEWRRLPARVRRRFSKRLDAGATAVYAGRLVDMRTSRIGRLLAQFARLVGDPLPRGLAAGGATTVTVTEDARSGGQFWSRIYSRKGGFPQVIHSIKRFRGPTGLEEYIGFGLSMALHVTCTDDRIVFRSDHYFLQAGRLRVRIPGPLSPGRVTVSHVDIGGGQFMFILDLTHPWAGELIHQEARFADLEDGRND